MNNDTTTIADEPDYTVEEISKPKRKRGFALMSPERVRELGKQGGIVAHERGLSHEFNSELARIAGAKGNEARRLNLAKAKVTVPTQLESTKIDKVA